MNNTANTAENGTIETVASKTNKQGKTNNPDIVAQANQVLETALPTTQNPQPITHYFLSWLAEVHPLATHNGLHDDEISWATNDEQCKELFAYLVSERIIVVPTLEKLQTEPNDELCNKVLQLPEFAGLTVTSNKPASFNQLEYEKIKPYLIALAKDDRKYFNKLLSEGKPFAEIAGIKQIWNKWSGNAQQYALFTFGLDILQIEYEQGRIKSESYIAELMTDIHDEVNSGTYTVVIDNGNGTVKVTLTSENPYAIKAGKRSYTSNPRLTDDDKPNQLSTAFDFTNGAKCPELLKIWERGGAMAESYANDTKNSKARRVVRLLKEAESKGISWQYAGTTGERQYYDCDALGLSNASPTTLVKDIAVHLGWAYNG